MNENRTNQTGQTNYSNNEGIPSTNHSIIERITSTTGSFLKLEFSSKDNDEWDEETIRKIHLYIIIGLVILFVLFLIFCFKFKINGKSIFMRLVSCSDDLDRSDQVLSSPESPDLAEDSKKSDSKKRSKQVEDQIRRLVEESRRQRRTDSGKSAYETADQRTERKRADAGGNPFIEEDEPLDAPADEEVANARDHERTERIRDKKHADNRKPAEEADDGGGASERPAVDEDRKKRIDKATIRHLVKNKSLIKQMKRTSNEANEVLNDPKVQIALKRIRIFAEKEKKASEQRRSTRARKAVKRRSDSDEIDRDEERPRARRKKSSRSYRVSEEIKASKSVIDSTKKFQELNQGLKKILGLRKKHS